MELYTVYLWFEIVQSFISILALILAACVLLKLISLVKRTSKLAEETSQFAKAKIASIFERFPILRIFN